MSSRGLWLAGLGIVIAAGCSSAVPTGTPGVERLGATVLRYRGPEVEAVMSYKFAARNLADDWLFLELAITASGAATVEVKREKISVRTPAGEEILLATQEEFRAAQGELSAKLAQADILGEPLGYFAGREERRMELFSTPFEGLAFRSFWTSYREVHVGRLYFHVPGGVQAGRWELRIELPESDVRVPFLLTDE